MVLNKANPRVVATEHKRVGELRRSVRSAIEKYMTCMHPIYADVPALLNECVNPEIIKTLDAATACLSSGALETLQWYSDYYGLSVVQGVVQLRFAGAARLYPAANFIKWSPRLVSYVTDVSHEVEEFFVLEQAMNWACKDDPSGRYIAHYCPWVKTFAQDFPSIGPSKDVLIGPMLSTLRKASLVAAKLAIASAMPNSKSSSNVTLIFAKYSFSFTPVLELDE